MAKKQKRTDAEVTAKLAGWIEVGQKLVIEARYLYLCFSEERKGICGCPLGMGYVGFLGKTAEAALDKYRSASDSGVSFFAREMQLSERLAYNVESAHLGDRRISTIIRHLREGKFDKFVNI